MKRKIVFKADEIMPSISAVSSVVNPKNSLPILDNILLIPLDEHTIKVMGSDGELWVTKVTSVVESDVCNSIAINAKSFVQALGNLGDKVVTMSVDDEKGSVTCDYGNGHFVIPYSDGETFPKPSNIDGVSICHVNSLSLLTSISRVSYACANDEIRLVLNGVNFDFHDDCMTTAATDGRFLAKYSDKSVKGYNGSFILPKKACGLLPKLLQDKTVQDIEIGFNDKVASFIGDGFSVITRLIEGHFPKYDSVIPTDNNIVIGVKKDEMLSAVKRIALMADKSMELIVLTFEQGNATISCEDVDYQKSASEYVNCDYDGEKARIGFAASKLLAVVQAVESDMIRIAMKDYMHACLFLEGTQTQSNEYTSLLMPLKIEG